MRTMSVVGKGHRGRAMHALELDQGSQAVDQGTEEHCNGRGTGPGHARLVVAGVAQGGGSGWCGSGRRQWLSAAAVMAGVGSGRQLEQEW